MEFLNVFVNKHPQSEQNFLCFCLPDYLEPASSEGDLQINVEDLAPVLFKNGLSVFIVNGEIFTTATKELTSLSTSKNQAVVRIQALSFNRILQVSTKFVKICESNKIVGATAQDGTFYLILNETMYNELPASKHKLPVVVHHMEVLLLTIDYKQYFSGERVTKMFKVNEGVVFQTEANSFYILSGLSSFSGLYVKPSSESEPLFQKLNLPNKLQHVCFKNNMVAYSADNGSFIWSQKDGTHKLSEVERSKQILILKEYLVCLSTAGKCFIFDLRTRIFVLRVDADSFGDSFTSVSYSRFVGSEHEVLNLLFFSESSQRLYLVDHTTYRAQQKQLIEFLAETKMFGFYYGQNREEEGKDDALIRATYEQKLKEGWRIKRVMDDKETLLFVFHRTCGVGHFLKHPLPTYQQRLADVTIITKALS